MAFHSTSPLFPDTIYWELKRQITRPSSLKVSDSVIVVIIVDPHLSFSKISDI